MKELLITQPDFMETFSCAGTSCREHCCKGQNVTLDRNRYQKYIKSPYADIKRIALTQITVTQSSLASWANIIPDNQGNCPFLDEQQLCQIHKYAGANALSDSCATYPRVEHFYKNQKIKSMSLSCPEVTRQVLFSTDALTLRFSTITQYDYYKAPDIVIDERLANRACAAIAVASHRDSIEENLWAINRFLRNYQTCHDVNRSKIIEIDNLRIGLISGIVSGKVAHKLMAVNCNPVIHDELLACLRDYIAQLPNIRGGKTLTDYATPLLACMADEQIGQRYDKQILNNVWQQSALPFFMEHTSVLRNYVLFRIHHDQLAMGAGLSAIKTFNLQMIDFFYLKRLIAAYASEHGQLTEDDVIGIVYSYHACRESTDSLSQQFMQRLSTYAMRDDFSPLSLLV
ncbi:flagellin lysine-N-methylase [Yersinia aleksiciae]|uniref:flagellin lysine-N-methylase n=1 Tax=Yersinia aleksiciae TaxID=263819 RepID=UPI0022FF2E1A|nr:flagellin lysine-N-methylase [Yersinia aleksiciae]MDA5499459.1 flagellin lysine-N-methylase [Yersinia aleksiciae]WQC71723.1 flagellin lysine-N-methylase [Yersinia aleksiciae]